MLDGVSLQIIHDSEKPLLDVVFVHGLTGSPENTWKSKQGFWPDWLAEDHPEVRVSSFGYPASMLKKWIVKELDIFELAKLGTEFLCGKDIGTRPVVFVAHSLGGILTKLILNHCHGSDDAQSANLACRTVRVMFLATPHTAPSLPKVVEHILPKWSSPHIKALSGEITLLDNIRENYGKYVASNQNLKNLAYYEAHKLSGVAYIVPKDCANPGISGTDLIPIEADHISICKPSSRDSAIYVSVDRHLKQAIKLAAGSPELSDAILGVEANQFTEKADYDRRDLWEKMSAASREHHYKYANSKQNSFARRYMSYGLQPGTRADFDLLLEEIEQKFQSQIYFPLICKGVSESDVDNAVQEKIINALANKIVGTTTFGATQIQSAIYFLTEQCHIRWDAES
jgi:hypothetical protein